MYGLPLARVIWTLGAALFLSAPAFPAPAQQARALRPGNKVRLTAPPLKPRPTLVGRLQAVEADSLTLIPEFERGLPLGDDGRPAPQTVAFKDVTRLEVSRGRNRWAGAGIGLAAGVIGGAVLGAVFHEEPKGLCIVGCTRGESAMLAGILGGAAGTLLGAAIGRERWERAPVPGPGG